MDKKPDFSRWYSYPPINFGLNADRFLVENVERISPLKEFPIGNALSLGCGDGRNALYLAKSGFFVKGIDIEKKAIERFLTLANNFSWTNRVEGVVADLRTYNLGEKRYDLIEAAASLSFMRKKEILAAVSKIKRALKPEGSVYIGVFTVDDPTFDGEHLTCGKKLLNKILRWLKIPFRFHGENSNWCEKLNTWQYYFNRGELLSLFSDFDLIDYRETRANFIKYTNAEAGEWGEVTLGLSLIFAKKQSSITGWYNKGVSLYHLGKLEEALLCFNKVLATTQTDMEVWYYKGITLGRLGRTNEALSCFEKASEIDPKYEEAWYGKGTALLQIGKLKEALSCFNKSIEIRNSYDEGWYGKGLTLMRMNKHNEAIVCFDKCLEINPNYKPALEERGKLIKSNTDKQ
jgi:tetratricopeptide (TPR) repeat protein